jgi:hypothetical protein
MNQNDRELIQAGVDDELDAAGRARLEALLAESEEARALQEDLERLAAFIGQVPPRPVPDELHRRIVDGIDLPRQGGVGRWLNFAALPGFVRYGLAGAAAVVLTVAVYRAGEGLAPEAERDLVGTIASRGDMAGGREVDQFRFGVPESNGQVTLVARGDVYALAFDLDLAGPTAVEIVLPDGGYRFDAFAQQDDALSAVSWSGNRLEAVAEGKRRFVLRLRRGSAPSTGEPVIALTFSQDGEAVYSGTLDLPPSS